MEVSKHFVFGLLFIFFLSAALNFYQYFSKQKNFSQNSSESYITKKYTNEEYGFTLNYPGWFFELLNEHSGAGYIDGMRLEFNLPERQREPYCPFFINITRSDSIEDYVADFFDMDNFKYGYFTWDEYPDKEMFIGRQSFRGNDFIYAELDFDDGIRGKSAYYFLEGPEGQVIFLGDRLFNCNVSSSSYEFKELMSGFEFENN